MSTAAPQTTAKTILIVDNDEEFAEALAQLVEAWGYKTARASDGLVALAIASEVRPQAVLVHLALAHGVDAYELARRLRATPATAGAFLASLTGYTQPEYRERSVEAGFDAHLLKPFEPTELRALLDQHCAASERPRSPSV